MKNIRRTAIKNNGHAINEEDAGTMGNFLWLVAYSVRLTQSYCTYKIKLVLTS